MSRRFIDLSITLCNDVITARETHQVQSRNAAQPAE